MKSLYIYRFLCCLFLRLVINCDLWLFGPVCASECVRLDDCVCVGVSGVFKQSVMRMTLKPTPMLLLRRRSIPQVGTLTPSARAPLRTSMTPQILFGLLSCSRFFQQLGQIPVTGVWV